MRKWRIRAQATLLVWLLASCASPSIQDEANRMISAGRFDEGLARLRLASERSPGDVALRHAYLRQRELWVNQLLAQADGARGTANLDESEKLYQRVLSVDTANARASAALAALEAERRHGAILANAEILLARKDLSGAEPLVRGVLAEDGGNRAARNLLRRIAEAGPRPDSNAPRLKVSLDRPITLEFRDAPLRTVFDLIARTAAVNFVFDRDVRPDLRTSIGRNRREPFVRLTLEISSADILLSDYDDWHFVLWNAFLACTEAECLEFERREKELGKRTLRAEREASWERIFDLDTVRDAWRGGGGRDSLRVQATFWELRREQVRRVERFRAKRDGGACDAP